MVVSACTDDSRPVLNVPKCDSDELILVAQSVQGADFVPCFDHLPPGWSLDIAQVGSDGTVVVLDSDRAGEGAATLVYAQRCDVEGFGDVPEDVGSIRRFERIGESAGAFESQQLFVFEGGCATLDFSFDDFDEARTGAEAIRAFDYANELIDTLQLVSRVELNAVIGQQDDHIQV